MLASPFNSGANMRKRLAGLIFGAIFMCSANAATWYAFNVRTDDAFIFFDSESLIKQSGSVAIWLKYVSPNKTPRSDGSYSSAYREIYSCTKRTQQILTKVLYGQDRNPISTFNGFGPVTEIAPETLGETILKAVCDPGFPNAKSPYYVLIGDNDIYAAVERNVTPRDDPAPK